MMSINMLSRVLGIAVAGAGMGQAAQGALVWIDPYGTGGANKVAVESIDILPGNALNKNVLVPNASQFTNYYQARVGAFLDANGNVIQVPGLNVTDPSDPNYGRRFEITVVAQFDLTVTADSTSTTTHTQLASSQPTNFVKFFYDTNVNADDLAGTGFNDGTPILVGSATSFEGIFLDFGTSSAFDKFGINNYPGITSDNGTGGATAVANVNTTDPAFFISPPSVIGLDFSTDNQMPFDKTNPSQLFMGMPANIGAINGVSGPDIQVQADASVSFVVPEPASLTVLGLASLALLRVRRRRR
jgi:hypothetical protein